MGVVVREIETLDLGARKDEEIRGSDNHRDGDGVALRDIVTSSTSSCALPSRPFRVTRCAHRPVMLPVASTFVSHPLSCKSPSGSQNQSSIFKVPSRLSRPSAVTTPEIVPLTNESHSGANVARISL